MTFVRRLNVRLRQEVKEVSVVLSGPVESRGSWMCRYEIHWPEGPSSGEIGGADAIQALYLAMEAVALALYASAHHKEGRLYWQRPGEGYGFPMPRAGRKDLIGDDRAAQA